MLPKSGTIVCGLGPARIGSVGLFGFIRRTAYQPSQRFDESSEGVQPRIGQVVVVGQGGGGRPLAG
jgi:hypothetical protein